jgi:hypothetical protein
MQKWKIECSSMIIGFGREQKFKSPMNLWRNTGMTQFKSSTKNDQPQFCVQQCLINDFVIYQDCSTLIEIFLQQTGSW